MLNEPLSTITVSRAAFDRVSRARYGPGAAFSPVHLEPRSAASARDFLASGGCCLLLTATLPKLRRSVKRLRLGLDDCWFTVDQPQEPIGLLIERGPHLMRTLGGTPFSHNWAVLNLAQGEVVEAQFRCGRLIAEFGTWSGSLAPVELPMPDRLVTPGWPPWHRGFLA